MKFRGSKTSLVDGSNANTGINEMADESMKQGNAGSFLKSKFTFSPTAKRSFFTKSSSVTELCLSDSQSDEDGLSPVRWRTGIVSRRRSADGSATVSGASRSHGLPTVSLTCPDSPAKARRRGSFFSGMNLKKESDPTEKSPNVKQTPPPRRRRLSLRSSVTDRMLLLPFGRSKEEKPQNGKVSMQGARRKSLSSVPSPSIRHMETPTESANTDTAKIKQSTSQKVRRQPRRHSTCHISADKLGEQLAQAKLDRYKYKKESYETLDTLDLFEATGWE